MRRLVVSLSAGMLLLVGGVVAGSAGAGSAGRPETVPSTEPGVATSEAPETTAAGVASTEASATTETASEPTEPTEAAASTEGHPLVGAWILVDTGDPESAPFLASFSADGIYHQDDFDGLGGIGAWEASSPTSAAMTFVQHFAGDEGEFGGSTTIRATIEVDPDGQTFTAEYTIEFGGEGAPVGEYGPGSVSGSRINVEPIGTPAGTLDEMFGGSEEGTEMTVPPTTT